MTPKQQLINAVNVFGLCVNIHEAISEHRIIPDTFKKSVRIDTGGKSVTIQSNYTHEALRIQSKNLLFMALGTTAIVIDTALDAVFGSKNPSDTSQIGAARAIIYMLRCAFAHDMAFPVWSCKTKYQMQYAINLPKSGLDFLANIARA